jgi:hypothetical protein
MTFAGTGVKLGVGGAIAVALISFAVPATPGAGLQPMKESGEGTRGKASGCEGSVNICYRFNGGAKGQPIDEGSLLLKYGWDSTEQFQNPYGKGCVDVVGKGTFRKGDNKIFISVEGPYCEATAGSVMKLYYTVTGGDGRFDQAQGRGGMLMKNEVEVTYRSGGTLKL